MNVIPFDDWTGRGRWGPTLRRPNPSAALVVHHTVTTASANPVRDAQRVEDVIWARRFSAKFTSVPYGWLLHPDGTLFTSRGTIYRNGANRATRAGATLSNRNTMSVALIGNYEKQSVTIQQRRAFDTLRTELANLGFLTNRANVVGHRALSHTACPGNALTQLLAASEPEIDTAAVLRYLHFLSKQVAARPLSQSKRSTGDAVKVVQQRLEAHGHNPGPIDGIFGPKTGAAVTAFQREANLTIDGVVGPATWAALLR